MSLSKTKKKKTKVIERWICDICKKASFSSYEDAIDHESICKVSSSNTTTNDDRKEEATAITIISDDEPNTTSTTIIKKNNDKVAPIFQMMSKSTNKKQQPTRKRKQQSQQASSSFASIFQTKRITSSSKPTVAVTTSSTSTSIRQDVVVKRQKACIGSSSSSSPWWTDALPHVSEGNNASRKEIIPACMMRSADNSAPLEVCDYPYSMRVPRSNEDYVDVKDEIQWQLKQLLQPPPKKKKKKRNQEYQSWSHLYYERPTEIHPEVLQFFQQARTRQVDLWDDDDNDTGGRVLLVTGPTGCGKTSMIHAAAKQCHCHLMELNTTEARGSAKLKRRFQDTTTSHSMVSAYNNNDNQNVYHCDSDSDDEYQDDTIQKKHVTVLLLDEVDQLWEEDVGFWSTVGTYSKKNTILVLTANKLPTGITNVEYQHVCIDKPTSVQCASKLTQMVRSQHLSWNADNKNYHPLLQLCNYDMRKLSHELHLYSYCSNNSTTPTITPTPTSTTVMGEQPVVTLTSVEPSCGKYNESTVVTIHGENFVQGAKLYVVGHVECTNVVVVSSTTIQAVIPPPTIPNDVDHLTGCYINTAQECWTCHYTSLHLSFPDRTASTELKFQYQFELMECRLQFLQTPPAAPVRRVTLEQPDATLLPTSSSVAPKPIYNGTLEHVEEMEQLAQTYEYASDDAYLKDYATYFGRPTLAGPVHGFTHDKNIPNLERRWEETEELFLGTSNAHMTSTNAIRDRHLQCHQSSLPQDEENDAYFTPLHLHPSHHPPTPLWKKQQQQRAHTLTSLASSLLHTHDKMYSVCFGLESVEGPHISMDARLACDYVSCLRQMAQRVPIPITTTTARRRTRRQQKQACHYFDQLSDQGSEIASSLCQVSLLQNKANI